MTGDCHVRFCESGGRNAPCHSPKIMGIIRGLAGPAPPTAGARENEPPHTPHLRQQCWGSSAFLCSATPAFGAANPPQWTLTAVSMPTNFTPENETGEDTYRVTLTNTGGAASGGSPISIADQLPAGLSLAAAGASGEDQLTHKPLTCVALTCTYSGTVVPEDSLTLTIPVDVEVDESTSVTNTVTASGGAEPKRRCALRPRFHRAPQNSASLPAAPPPLFPACRLAPMPI